MIGVQRGSWTNRLLIAADICGIYLSNGKPIHQSQQIQGRGQGRIQGWDGGRTCRPLSLSKKMKNTLKRGDIPVFFNPHPKVLMLYTPLVVYRVASKYILFYFGSSFLSEAYRTDALRKKCGADPTG